MATNGRESTAEGQRRSVYGEGQMAKGKWRRANGEGPMVKGKWRRTNGKGPTAKGKRLRLFWGCRVRVWLLIKKKEVFDFFQHKIFDWN